MPHRVLQVVAGLIVVVALGAFAMGVVNAPNRGRLPGERGGGAAPGVSAATAAAAPEVTPLSQERIEGPPPAAELTPEEKARQEADKLARAQPDVTAKVPAAPGAPAAVAQPTAPVPVLPSVENPPGPPADEAPH
ncbi:MAG TPA: hypothetical protein VGC92_01135 [Phenylobacterium sp.]